MTCIECEAKVHDTPSLWRTFFWGVVRANCSASEGIPFVLQPPPPTHAEAINLIDQTPTTS
jgi:hypothetical protein